VIVGSLLLIITAAVLLVLGLLRDANVLLVASIVASLLAAVALFAGTRRPAADDQAPDDDGADEPDRPGDWLAPDDEGPTRGDFPVVAATDAENDGDTTIETPSVRDTTDTRDRARDRAADDPHAEAAGSGVYGSGEYGSGEYRSVGYGSDERASGVSAANGQYDNEEPADEPPAQQVSAADTARVAGLPVDVLVIDGRPRYHLPGCVHLLGRENEPLPIAEAVELGFTPCGLCEPDSALLAEARHA